MKKKILSLAFAMMLSVSMIACGGESVETVEENSVETEIVEEVEQAPEEVEGNFDNLTQGTATKEQMESYIEEEIVLTTDNASNYFDIVIEQETDAFGDPIESYYYILRMKDGYYAYLTDVVVRYQWEGEELDSSYNGSGIVLSVRSEYDEQLLDVTFTKIQGTIYKMNIPEELWLDNGNSATIMIIDNEGQHLGTLIK